MPGACHCTAGNIGIANMQAGGSCVSTVLILLAAYPA